MMSPDLRMPSLGGSGRMLFTMTPGFPVKPKLLATSGSCDTSCVWTACKCRKYSKQHEVAIISGGTGPGGDRRRDESNLVAIAGSAGALSQLGRACRLFAHAAGSSRVWPGGFRGNSAD